VTEFTLFLSPEMADLTKEITVNVNGTPFKAMPRRVEGMRDYAYQVNISLA
jgi:hypothetical protein